MTIDQTTQHVSSGGNAMCDDRTSAYVVASNFKKSYFHNAHQNGAPGYYPHFHPWEGANHPHIWYIN